MYGTKILRFMMRFRMECRRIVLKRGKPLVSKEGIDMKTNRMKKVHAVFIHYQPLSFWRL